MKAFPLLEPATADNFDEARYLAANPDVAAAVRQGSLPSARVHFEHFGTVEGRRQRARLPGDWKQRKLARLRPLLRADVPCLESADHLDCLSDTLRQRYAIVPTENVSQHDYDHEALALIERHGEGLVLDCGAGMRNTYYANVVNYEIVPYDSTDVLGVAEELPFRDDSFDAVLCLNVLEHVKDPFRVARELMRVLKPGGELMVVAPFLQPLHGYPHHYFNMTREGLATLFEPLVERRFAQYGAMHPIWALNWFLHRYAAGLPEGDRAAFEAMTVRELLAPPTQLEAAPLASALASDASVELASAHALFARKPTTDGAA